MTKLKAAVIGVGSMGSRHARVYVALPETELVAAVLNDTVVPVTGTDGLIALRLAMALVESGAEHRLLEV